MKKKTRALIIDDEVEICNLLSRILRNKSIDVHCAGSLSEARSSLETYEPSLIFIDNHLPDGLGVQFVDFLRTGHPQAKVIIITGQEIEPEDVKEEDELPPVVFKPFTSEKIYSLIDAIS